MISKKIAIRSSEGSMNSRSESLDHVVTQPHETVFYVTEHLRPRPLERKYHSNGYFTIGVAKMAVLMNTSMKLGRNKKY